MHVRVPKQSWRRAYCRLTSTSFAAYSSESSETPIAVEAAGRESPRYMSIDLDATVHAVTISRSGGGCCYQHAFTLSVPKRAGDVVKIIAVAASAEKTGQWVQSIIECGVDNDYAAAHRGDGYARLPDDLDSLGSPTAASKKHRRGSVGNVSGRVDLTMIPSRSNGDGEQQAYPEADLLRSPEGQAAMERLKKAVHKLFDSRRAWAAPPTFRTLAPDSPHGRARLADHGQLRFVGQVRHPQPSPHPALPLRRWLSL